MTNLLLIKETIIHELTHAQQKRDYPEIFDTEHKDDIIRIGKFVWNEYFACYKAGMKFRECAIGFRLMYIESIERNYQLYCNQELSKQDAGNIIGRELAYLLGYLRVDDIYFDIQIDTPFFIAVKTRLEKLAIELNRLQVLGCKSWESINFLRPIGDLVCELLNQVTTN